MILYKYTCEAGKDILLNSRIRIKDPAEFDDPFELAVKVEDLSVVDVRDCLLKNEELTYKYFMKAFVKGKKLGNWEDCKKELNDPIRAAVRANKITNFLNKEFEKVNNLKINIAQYFMLTCFCGGARNASDEVLMWSHYSEGHKGLRFWFDSEILTEYSETISQVVYKAEMVSIDPKAIITGQDERNRASLMESLKIKSLSWEYEQEYRWFVDKKFYSFDPISQKPYVGIDLNSIKRIDFGMRCGEKIMGEVVDKINSLSLSIELRRAVPSSKKFELEYVKL